MSPTDIQTLVAAAQTIATVLSGLGVPGLLALALSGPAIVLVTVLVLDAVRASRLEKIHQEFRRDSQSALETYRSDMLKLQLEADDRHSTVSRYYENNVTLVKNYELMAEALQSLVANNTRVTERLVTIVETRSKS